MQPSPSAWAEAFLSDKSSLSSQGSGTRYAGHLNRVYELFDPAQALNVVLVQSLPVVGLMIVDGCDGVVAEHSVLCHKGCYGSLGRLCE